MSRTPSRTPSRTLCVSALGIGIVPLAMLLLSAVSADPPPTPPVPPPPGAAAPAAGPPGAVRAVVTAVDEAGQPLAHARLAPALRGADGVLVLDPGAAGGLQADEQGRLTLADAPPEGGVWVLWAPGRIPRRLPDVAAGTSVALAPASSLAGSVRWSGGRVAADLALRIEPLGEPDPVALRLRTDAEGRYRTDLLAGGPWRLGYLRADGAWIPLKTGARGAGGDVLAPLPGGLRGRLLDGRAAGTVGVPGLGVRLIPLPRAGGGVPPLEAISGEDGSFLRMEVPVGVYELELLDPDWMFDQPAARVEVPGPGRVREEHWFVMRRSRLAGRVLGRERKPVAGARLRLLPDPLSDGVPSAPLVAPPATRSDADGRFVFERLVPAPGYRLLAWAPGFAPYVSAPFEVDPGGVALPHEVTLPSGWTLEVEVRDATAKRFPGALVEVAAAAHALAGLDPLFEAFTGKARTDANGTATFEGLAEEDVWLTLSVPGHVPVAERVERPGTSAYRQHKVLLLAAPTLTGLVSDALGRPEPGRLVRVRVRGLPGARAYDAVSGADGRYRLADLPPQALDLDVLVSGERSLLHIEGVDPEQGTLDLVLPVRQGLGGTVDGLRVGGAPAEVLLEAPVRRPDEPEVRWRVVDRRVLSSTGREARFRFDDLAPGPYAVRARQGGRDTEPAPVTVGDREPEALALLLPEGGSIAGEVLDDRSRPVLGVRVTLVRLRGDGAMADRPDGPLVAVTDDRGAYLFEDVAPGLWRIEAEERGVGRDLDVLRLADGESLLVRTLSLVAGGALEGRVEDAQGRPVDGARLRLRALEADLDVRTALTDGLGRYRVGGLPAGPYRVVVVDGPDARFAREALVEVTDLETTLLDFRAEGDAEIEGLVLRLGRRVPGVALVAEQVTEDPGIPGRTLRAVTDGAGAFALGGLTAGRWSVTLEDGTARTGGEVLLSDGERRHVDLELWEGRLVGEVVTRDGRPVGDALVVATPTTAVVGVLSAAARTDPNGRFTLSGVPLVRYDLTARAEGSALGAATAIQADRAGSERPVQLVLDAGGTLEVEVRGADGRPAAGARLSVRASGPSAALEVVVLAGPGGRVRIDGVPAGRAFVEAWARDLGRTGTWVEVEEGRSALVRLGLEPSGSIALTVGGALPPDLRAAWVEIRRAGDDVPLLTRSPRVGSGSWLGALRWIGVLLQARDLPAGDYEIRMELPWRRLSGRALVRVRAGDVTRARLTLTPSER